MIFKNFCAVFMGNTDKAKDATQKISEIKINVIDAKGIMIITFSSVVDIKELRDWFKSFNFNFLLFDLSESSSAFNIEKENIARGLFGFLEYTDAEVLTDKFNKILETEKEEIVESSKGLEQLLNEALADEKYEEAARLRDMINKEKQEQK
jgi:UvrB/uvrC motif